MAKLNMKLKGTTLVETIVSMVLIVLLMCIVTRSLLQADREAGTTLKPYAIFLVKNNLGNLPESEGTSEITDEYSGLRVTRQLVKYNNLDSIYVFQVNTVNPEDKIIASGRRIVSYYDMRRKSHD
jgi:hypothetical protein